MWKQHGYHFWTKDGHLLIQNPHNRLHTQETACFEVGDILGPKIVIFSFNFMEHNRPLVESNYYF